MATVRPISPEAELTLVEHLSELRARIVGSLAAFVLAFALCFWQNNKLLALLNAPLPGDRHPITFGVTEPFMSTVTVSFYASILLALPVLLYQLYGFFLPALSPTQRRGVGPVLALVPVLFISGVVFGYLVVLPAAIKFLLNFNANQFNIQIRARDYYGFVTQTLIALGVVFQVPVAILAATRLGITTPGKLRRSRRYAYVVAAVVAMLLPGTDPVTMLVEMVPLLALYELSIVLASLFGTRGRVSPRVSDLGAASGR
jgi:sec-independent protein translocase protein TatC